VAIEGSADHALASLRVSAGSINPTEFVSATPSQGGPCSNHVYQGTTVICDSGRLPAGATAVLDVVLIPQELGTNEAHVTDYVGYSGSEEVLGSPLRTNDARTSVRVYSR
jgi:hypothetical protein